ncbi:hypothetical protein SAMN02745751_02469 [Dethiosulfatibacter aminovorans DSM 17477]|uniref:Uncharacterized protein n=1 Tax=Dethiosulfatibacter aminovorans DSM 17477 TaxID=1121476 RepID=A0A1M6IZL0_9FIRM|nr:hypothetical protein [Dethiosulfatibacter aminovorans]SHJ39895.1 hypothetical protein SAMN02745751_02469 [Dethiosulfatibacter aminovorans DSM 17477]
MNFALKAKRIKNVYYFVLAAAIAQQLYIPADYKYFHLALLFLTLITADMYKFDYRDYANEYRILFLIGCSTLVVVADGLSPVDFRILYYILMSTAMYFVIRLIHDTVKVFSMGGEGKKFINDRNVKLFKNNGLFMRAYGKALIAIIVLAFIYMIYDLIILV